MTALERTEAALRRLLADLQADLEVLEAIATRLDNAPIASDSPSDAPVLSFRHFFRHAYAVELDSRRLAEHRERVSRVHPEVVLGLKRLHAHLEATLEQLEISTRDDG